MTAGLWPWLAAVALIALPPLSAYPVITGCLCGVLPPEAMEPAVMLSLLDCPLCPLEPL